MEATVTVNRGASVVKTLRFLTASSSLVVAVSALGFVLGAPSACSQPPTLCAVQPGEGIARYVVVSKSSGCDSSTTLPGTTNADPGTFPIGLEGYPVDPTDPNGPTTPASMALQPEWLGARIEDAQLNAAVDPALSAADQAAMASYPYASAAAVPAPPPQGTGTDYPYAWGQFTTVTPDSSGICHLPDMTSALTYPDIPAHQANQSIGSPLGQPTYVNTGAVSDQPATQVTYKWTNVRVYVSAADDGTQTYADLTVIQDSCTISYHVSILVPRVLCGTTDAQGNAFPEPTLCDPNPDGVDNPSGSGINAQISPSCENIGSATNPDYECLPPAQDPLSQLQ
jgi:hypothetical protein